MRNPLGCSMETLRFLRITDGRQLSMSAIGAALSLVEDYDLARPEFAILPDGNVKAAWTLGSASVHLTFLDDGHICHVVKQLDVRGRFDIHVGDGSVTEEIDRLREIGIWSRMGGRQEAEETAMDDGFDDFTQFGPPIGDQGANADID